MDRARFRRLVQRALDGLPPEVSASLDNIAIVVEREPSRADLQTAGIEPGDDLFGLYVGVPLPERSGALQALPDRIVIYQGPLERGFHPRDIPREVQKTVRHELAHYFGIDDDRLTALGMG
ncbi:MAG: metallopeptidase family protein [Chloroflexi bacterium]|nr:MAG: metallopeptidase family protein [Chloroflexota bacterium]